MIFSAKWPIRTNLSWQRVVAQLIQELEKDGCVVSGDGSCREVFVPGLDERFMAYFRGASSGSHEGLMTEDWKSFIQRELWGRAEIRLNSESRTIEYAWTYWTSFQIAFHLILAVLFFGTNCRIEWAWVLFVPTLLALADSYKLKNVFALWHSRCSLGPTASNDV